MSDAASRAAVWRDGAVLLAGGASERMGIDKAALRLDGRSLLAHVHAVLADAVDVVVVVGRPGQRLDLPADALRVDDDPEHAGQGPLVGVLAGLRALHERGITRAYLASVDAPMLSRAHVDWMLAHLEDPGRTPLGAVPEHDGQVHPLAGAVRVDAALDGARRLLEQDRRSVHALFEGLGAVHVTDLPDPRVLWPCNTPEEWATIQRALS